MSRKQSLYAIVGTAVPVGLLLLWYFGTKDTLNAFFPPLETILERFQELWMFDHFTSDVLPSILNLFIGYILAVIVGILVGFILGMNKTLSAMFEPAVTFMRSIPAVALIPILITLMGFDNSMRVASIVIASTFPTLVSTLDGISSVEPSLKDVSAVYRFSRRDRVFQVYLPSALPKIVSGMQISLVYAFVVMVGSEMLGPSQGIGAMTLLAQQTFMSADMWAGILLLSVIGFISNVLFELFRSRVLSWYINSKKLERQS